MQYNELLLKVLIDETNLHRSDGVFTWATDWLGYLPYGQYQWLEINNKDIDPRKLNFEWDLKDLVELMNLDLIVKLSEEKISDDNAVIKFKISL